MITEKKENFLFKILKLLYYLVIIFVCLIAVFLLFYIISSQLHADDEDYKPKLSLYTIVSPSMTPVINVYDIVVNIRPESPKDIQIGDIITYKSTAANTEGMTITHRVISISQLPDGTYEFMTQGDNNDEPDSVYVTYDNIIGKEILIIPYLGRIQFLIANQKGWLFLLLIPVSLYLLRELFKLIDLLGLRKRVDKVVGTTEDSYLERRKVEKQKEKHRKELLKEELRNQEVKKDSKKRSEFEHAGFLEEYNETTINISENKYQKSLSKLKELKTQIADDDKIKTPTKVETTKVKKNESPVSEPLVLPKTTHQKEVINEQYEILDTDELTSKIKEYDNKIEKLNKMIKDMENIEPKKEDENIVEINDYLEGSKIKVIKVEEVKKSKSSSNKKINNDSSKKTKNYDYNFEFTDLIPIDNIREKIQRPVGEDIKKSSNKKNQQPKANQKLKLRPNEVKKINRSKKQKQEQKKQSLKLNPQNIKKINRSSKKTSSDSKTKETEKKKQSKKNNSKKLFVIEKVK